MEKILRVVKSKTLFLILLTLAGAFLLFKNLDNSYLWQDEAETALLGRSLLARGIPVAYDGKNYFSQNGGADTAPGHVWRWNPWLQYYVCAGSFAFLGESTWAARFPFALAGLGTILLTYFLGGALWRSERAARLAAILLLFSVPFLILSRQCRYYSLTALLALLVLHGYVALLDGKKWGGPVFFGSSALFFHAHYVLWAAFTAAVALHALAVERSKAKTVLFLTAGHCLVNLPALVFFLGADTGVAYGDPVRILRYLSSYIRDFSTHIFPTALWVIPLLLGLFERRKLTDRLFRDPRVPKRALLLILCAAVTIPLLSVFSLMPYFRYLTPLLPVACLFTALLLEWLWAFQTALGVFVLAILVLRPALRGHLYELTHPFRGPVGAIVEYLRAHGADTDTVAVTYGDLPLKFYTNMRVVGGMTGEDLSDAGTARWVILRKHTICERDALVRRYLVGNVPGRLYRRIVLDAPDTPFENRETPADHLFRTASGEDPVVIYERKAPS